MAGTPRYKIRNPQGEYVASCKHLEDASVLVAALGDGTKVYEGAVSKHSLLWTEGLDGSAGASSEAFRKHCEARLFRNIHLA
jgi:hypothetical protein